MVRVKNTMYLPIKVTKRSSNALSAAVNLTLSGMLHGNGSEGGFLRRSLSTSAKLMFTGLAENKQRGVVIL